MSVNKKLSLGFAAVAAGALFTKAVQKVTKIGDFELDFNDPVLAQCVGAPSADPS